MQSPSNMTRMGGGGKAGGKYHNKSNIDFRKTKSFKLIRVKLRAIMVSWAMLCSTSHICTLQLTNRGFEINTDEKKQCEMKLYKKSYLLVKEW